MYNSLEFINKYFTKSNSCKMRERERERERERVMISENTFSPIHDDIYDIQCV